MMNHSVKPEFEFEEDYPEWWDWYIRKNATNMKRWYDVLISQCTVKEKNPIYICRYEDLITQPKQELMQLFAFLLDCEDLTGTNCEKRIDEVVALGAEASQIYKLKSTTRTFNANSKRYTTEQIEYIKETLGEHLHFFGYTKHPEIEHDTAFFDFGNNDSPKNISAFKGYLQLNKNSLKEVS